MIRKTGKPTRIFVIDEQPIYKYGLDELFRESEDFVVCGYANAIDQLDPLAEYPDIFALDIVVNKSNGIGSVEELIRQYPKASILVVSSHDKRIFADRCLRAGAKGYVMKTSPIQEHLDAYKILIGGNLYLSPSMKRVLLSRMSGHEATDSSSLFDRLSNRELLIIQHIGESMDNREIAKKMKISVKTIESHRSRIKSKLELSSASGLIRIGTRLKYREL